MRAFQRTNNVSVFSYTKTFRKKEKKSDNEFEASSIRHGILWLYFIFIVWFCSVRANSPPHLICFEVFLPVMQLLFHLSSFFLHCFSLSFFLQWKTTQIVLTDITCAVFSIVACLAFPCDAIGLVDRKALSTNERDVSVHLE